MRRVDIDKIEIGSRLARSVYNASGQTLLSQGTVLNSDFIKRLKGLGFTSIYIEDGFIDDVAVDNLISEETRNQAVCCIKEVMASIRSENTFQACKVKKVVSDIVEELIANGKMMMNLSDIRSFDDYTFFHSVNVTVISITIGMTLFYPRNKLLDLGLGVLLHDIGKTQIPLGILNKPGKLTDDEFRYVQKHTWFGFEILRSNPDIKITSAHVALQHHERMDGSGYPRQLKGNDILEYARISAIADVYDALVHDRCYRRKLPIHKVYEYFVEQTKYQFDSHFLDRFIQKIALYPQGTKVLLDDGRSGFVVKQSDTLTRPLVRLFWEHGQELDKPVEVNLQHEKSLSIKDVIE